LEVSVKDLRDQPFTRKEFDVNVALPWVPLLGRVLLSFIFLWSIVGDLGNWSGRTAYMASSGIPLPAMFLAGAVVFKLAGGIFLILGYRARLGALLLLIFLIPTTLIFHAFWNVPQAQYVSQLINFQKNLGLMGGLLMVIAMGPGRWSLSGRS
jgi:putative oxidoreductase